ncbi:MAG: response regulator [Ketobacteraceae bacterium]|nr:response regulator [Ketobacteraceae bacterium]
MSDRLYIVDDEADHARMLADYATELGWAVKVEQDPARFLNYDHHDSGVLVLDLIMPDMDGIEIIQGIAAASLPLSLILVSGFDYRILESARMLAQAHGITVHGCLEKPIDFRMFKALLGKAGGTANP